MVYRFERILLSGIFHNFAISWSDYRIFDFQKSSKWVCSCMHFILEKNCFSEVTSSDKGVGKKLTRIAVAYCFVYLGILLWSIFSSINTHYQLIRAADVDLQSLYLGFSTDMVRKICEKLVYVSNFRWRCLFLIYYSFLMRMWERVLFQRDSRKLW